MIEIKEYTIKYKDEWNRFISSSKNGTFILDRHYMDYHSDRFNDASLMFYNSKGKLVGVFPANKKENTIFSHGGLTYGGLIVNYASHYSEICEIFNSLRMFYVENGIKKIFYKAIPHIYHSQPAEEDLYWLHSNGAQLINRSVSSVVDTNKPLPFSELRRRKIKKASEAGVIIMLENFSFVDAFWKILENNLWKKHGVNPVHNINEIKLLQHRFPCEMTLSVAIHDNAVVAGCLIYKTNKVAHVQYISANEKGKEFGALDILFFELIKKYGEEGLKYFDFGISTENGGKFLNEGLLFQKEGFGGRAICYDTYEYKIP